MHTCCLHGLPLHICQFQHMQGGLWPPCHVLSAKQKQPTPQQGSLQQQGQGRVRLMLQPLCSHFVLGRCMACPGANLGVCDPLKASVRCVPCEQLCSVAEVLASSRQHCAVEHSCTQSSRCDLPSAAVPCPAASGCTSGADACPACAQSCGAACPSPAATSTVISSPPPPKPKCGSSMNPGACHPSGCTLAGKATHARLHSWVVR